ncbi:RNA-guided endonuclease TnpB family protein [Streptomyces sp. NPDC001941]|uniref:RNA-guided endonuclease InsQ/TnpB family protein n=1 Tax=Streptomyces sp. NPDC001941 TaxID=3154659 RepID=UPI00333382C6
MPTTTVLRAYRYALDPNAAQLADLQRHAGAARWAFNHALAMKVAADKAWRAAVDVLVAQGMDVKTARKQIKRQVPGAFQVQKDLNAIKPTRHTPPEPEGFIGPRRPCPFHAEISARVFQSGFQHADAAWSNWRSSQTGQRAGQKMGFPRFKRKHTAREAFKLCHNKKAPEIRPDGYRRLRIPKLGSIRLHQSNKRMTRLIQRGQAVVSSVTISRSGHRWYASVLCEVQQQIPDKPSRAQRTRGSIGVDLGVRTLAGLSKPLALDKDHPPSQLVANPRHADRERKRLTKAQRAFARTTKGSNRRTKAARRIGRIQHLIAERRATSLHTLTKRLTTAHAMVCVENLHVRGMTASARGTVDNPGRQVRQKAALNRAILDASFGELRRQITYKASWYGSQILVLDRWWPSSKTCSHCGWRNPSLRRGDRVFNCTECGLSMDRDINAALNIERETTVACGKAFVPGRRKTPVEKAEVPKSARAKGSVRRSGKDRPTPVQIPEGQPFGHPRSARTPLPRPDQGTAKTSKK